MSTIKTVRLNADNHEWLKNLAFGKDSSIEFETNQIISTMRELEEENLLANQ